MRGRLLAIAALLGISAVAWAAPSPPQDLGEPSAVRGVLCATEFVRVQFYEYEPEDPEYWRAVSLHFADEQAWWALLVWDYPGSEQLHFWVDLNRDGRPDTYELMTNEEFEQRHTWSVCGVLESLGVSR